MLTKRQFLTIYNQVVLGIRQIKTSNDKINKSIGILHDDNTIYQQSEQQREIIENLLQKINALIQELQKNYMDLETARKTGIVKQQLRIQKDRREQLIVNVSQINEESKQKQKKIEKPPQLVHNSYNKKIPTIASTIEMQGCNNYPIRKSSLLTDDNIDSQNQSNNSHSYQYEPLKLQLADYDLQMERKLLQQKHKQLTHYHKKMVSINSIVKQTSHFVMEQGDQLNIVDNQLFKTYKNMEYVNTELAEANKYQRKSRKKYVVCFLLLLAILVAVLFSFLI